MEKLELKSGEQIEIQTGAAENSVKVEVESVDAFKELYNKFTDDNLSQISFLNDAGVLCAIYKNKTLAKAELETATDEETEENQLIATFTLKDIDTTKLEIKSLRETVETLVLNTLEAE
jgi:predicted transcriptional regulator